MQGICQTFQRTSLKEGHVSAGRHTSKHCIRSVIQMYYFAAYSQPESYLSQGTDIAFFFAGNTDKWRHVVYVCYQPRSLATEKDLALKREAYNDRRVTTHWPAMNVKLFPKEGNSYYGKAGTKKPDFRVMPTRERVETDLTKQLAGVKPYPKEALRQGTPLVHLAV